MSENLQKLMRMAFLNNSYDYDAMNNAINRTWMNSYSYLYGLQKSHVDYEELFYYSGETISRNSKKIGNLYLDKLMYANFDVDYDMIHVYNREEFRRSEYYNKFYDFMDLVNHPEIFSKMPIIMIDDKAIWDYKIFSSKDFTTIKLPFKRKFVLYDERNNVLFGKYNRETGEFDLDIGQDAHGGPHDTNILYVEVSEDYEGNPYKTAYIWNGEGYIIYKEGFKDWDEVIYKEHKIQVLIVDNIFYQRVIANKNQMNINTSYNTITLPKSMLGYDYGMAHNKGTLFCSIHYPNSARRAYELGSMIIPLEDNGDSYVGRLSSIEAWKVYTTNINMYISFFFIKDLYSHEFYFGGNEVTIDDPNHLMVIEKEPFVPYECPIAVENFMLFRLQDNSKGYQLVKNTEVLNLHYPNIYSFDGEYVEKGDKYRVYYFYKEETDLKYTVLFDFYFKFLIVTFSMYDSLEEILDRIYRNDFENTYTDEELESFMEAFNLILNYQYFNHQYNETDFLYRYLPYNGNYDKEPIEYKDETLKTWINVEPHVLRDYVLEQKKLGATYHLFTNTIDLSSRLRYDTKIEFDNQIHEQFLDGAYVFAMQNVRPYPELLDIRVFVDGIFVQDMYQKRKLYMDYIYIPCKYVTSDSYIELEVFPSYTFRRPIKFTSLDDYEHVILDKPEEKIWPTISDIYFTSDVRPGVRYSSSYFSMVEHYRTGIEEVIYRPTENNLNYYRKDGLRDVMDGSGNVTSIPVFSLYDFHNNKLEDKSKTYNDLTNMVKDGSAYKDILPSLDRGSYEAKTIDDRYPVKYTRLESFDVKPTDPDVLNIPMTLNITKNSMRIIVKITGDGVYPYFRLTHTDFNFSPQYIRIFRNGRLIPRCKYQFNKLYEEPTLMLLDEYKPGEEIMLDISPYRYEEVYYQEELEPGQTLIDLRDYITKPFDIRYYEVYMNGRKLSLNNVFAVSPYQITLVNLHSIYNLEIFERERDWEYFGTNYKEHLYYYNIEDLFTSNFISEDIKNQLIKDIIDRDKDPRLNIYPNTNEEEKQDRTDIRKFVQMYSFYFDELIPKTYTNPDRKQESKDIMENVYNFIDDAYRRIPAFESRTEEEIERRAGYIHALLLDPDITIGDGNPNNRYEVYPVGVLYDRVPEQFLAQVPELIVTPNITEE